MRGLKQLSSSCSSSISFTKGRFLSPLTTPHHRTTVRQSHSPILTSDLPDITIPHLPLPDFLFSRSPQLNSNTVFVDSVSGQYLTMADTQGLAKSFGSALAKLGAGRGCVVAVVLHNCPEWPVVFLGATGIGATVTTINPVYTAQEIATQLQDSQARYIVTSPAALGKMEEAARGREVTMMVLGEEGGEGKHLAVEDMLKDTGDCYPVVTEYRADDVAVLPYSSGTTGPPKGVMLTHANLVANICQASAPALDFVQEEDSTLCLLPMFHIFALANTMAQCLWHGAKMVTLPSFQPHLCVSALLEHRPTFLHLVPPLVGFLATHPAVTPKHLESLRFIFVGAAPVGTTLINMFHKKAPQVEFREGYGMSELSPTVLVSRPGVSAPGSTGKLVPNTAMKVLDVDTGEALGPGRRGELCFQGPQVMKGYLANKAATENTVREGWLHTGDIGYYDDNEFVFIVDRLKELIKVKGLQVAPAELEDVIRKITGVSDVAVIGVDDNRAGEVPRAYVVKEDTALDEAKVKVAVEEQLAPHKHLAGGVEFVAQIPKSASGKILRKDLKASFNRTRK